jgi:hypothetical protein
MFEFEGLAPQPVVLPPFQLSIISRQMLLVGNSAAFQLNFEWSNSQVSRGFHYRDDRQSQNVAKENGIGTNSETLPIIVTSC